MTYGPEDLKKIADEMLGDFQTPPVLRQRILTACQNKTPLAFPVRKKVAPARWAVGAAAAVLVCAIGVTALSSTIGKNSKTQVHAAAEAPAMQKVLVETTNVSADATLMQVSAQTQPKISATAAPVSQNASPSVEINGISFFLAKGGNNLYGVTDASGKWLIDAKYESGYIDPDGSIVLFSNGKSTIFSPDDLLKKAL